MSYNSLESIDFIISLRTPLPSDKKDCIDVSQPTYGFKDGLATNDSPDVDLGLWLKKVVRFLIGKILIFN